MKRLSVVLVLLVIPCGAGAQEFWASGVIANPTSRVSLDGTVQSTSGVWGGLEIGARLGRFRIRGVGTRGQLTPSGSSAPLDREVGEMGGTVGYAVSSWLAAEAGYTARAFNSATGRQQWGILGVGVHARQTLGTPVFEGFARISYLPLVDVTGQESPNLSYAAETGVTLRPSEVPLLISVSYAIERFEFPGGTRVEQFERLTVSVGVLVSRIGGKWSLGG